MKTTIILFSLIIIMISCKDHENSPVYKYRIDIQSTFDGENVQIILDGKELVNKEFATNHSVGVCLDGMLSSQITAGNHTLKVSVNSVTKTETFNLKGTLYSGVNYDNSTKKISVSYSDLPFAYD